MLSVIPSFQQTSEPTGFPGASHGTTVLTDFHPLLTVSAYLGTGNVTLTVRDGGMLFHCSLSPKMKTEVYLPTKRSPPSFHSAFCHKKTVSPSHSPTLPPG